MILCAVPWYLRDSLSLRDVEELLVDFLSSRRRHTRYWRDWSSDVCSSDLIPIAFLPREPPKQEGENRQSRHGLVELRRVQTHSQRYPRDFMGKGAGKLDSPWGRCGCAVITTGAETSQPSHALARSE